MYLYKTSIADTLNISKKKYSIRDYETPCVFWLEKKSKLCHISIIMRSSDELIRSLDI